MRAGSDHEGDGGWPGKDRFTWEFEKKYLKRGYGFRIIASEGQEVFDADRTDS